MRLILARVIVMAAFAPVLLQPAAWADETPVTLNWLDGPAEAKLGDQAVLALPAGYRFLGSKETIEALEAMGNFPSKNELGLVAPSGEGDWFMVIRFYDTGYVRDEDADNWDHDEMLAAMKEGTEEQNTIRVEKGFPTFTVRGWEERPHYDKQHNKVVWAVSLDATDHIVVNYNTLALGRHGYIGMNMVGQLEELPQLKPHVGTLLANTNFVQGKRYVDFDSTTDKVAAVGLGALVAGAAFKTGLLAKLWAFVVPVVVAFKKLIILAVIGLAGLLRWLFKKRDTPVAAAAAGPGGDQTPG